MLELNSHSPLHSMVILAGIGLYIILMKKLDYTICWFEFKIEQKI